jgi:rod shape determining protein RodA
MIGKNENSSYVTSIDWGTIAIYVGLVLLGIVNIYAAVYDNTSGFFDFSSRAGSQMIWFGVALVLAMFIMLLDGKYYYTWAYPIYWFSVLLLISVLLFGEENKGAKSWLMFGGKDGFGFQPSEFVKVSVALALARFMNEYGFNLKSRQSLIKVFAIIGIPLMLVLSQNDTGSALVFLSFMFMLFREGLNPWIYIVGLVLIALFVLSFLFQPIAVLIMLMCATLLVSAIISRSWRDKLTYAAATTLLSLLVYFVLLCFTSVSYYVSLLIAIVI